MAPGCAGFRPSIRFRPFVNKEEPAMNRFRFRPIGIWCLLLFLASAAIQNVAAAAPGKVSARVESDLGTATIRVQTVGRFHVKIDVDPKIETRPLRLRVELPISGRSFLRPAAKAWLESPFTQQQVYSQVLLLLC